MTADSVRAMDERSPQEVPEGTKSSAVFVKTPKDMKQMSVAELKRLGGDGLPGGGGHLPREGTSRPRQGGVISASGTASCRIPAVDGTAA
jgi:hypothetical protein